MAKVSCDGKGKTLYVELSIYANASDPHKNLTISCPHKDTRFKTSLSDNGLKKFREYMLQFYDKQVLSKK